MTNITRYAPIICVLILLTALNSFAQTTAFNFQGRLNDGSSPANGQYDLQFKLFDGITGGAQIGTTLSRPNLTLINGVFSTTLNFGATAFESGNRFLEISVRPLNSPNAFVVLGARQQILSVPLAVRASTAAEADHATNAQNAVNAQNATNATNAASATNAQNASNAALAQNSLSLGGFGSNSYARLNFENQGDVIGTNIASNGSLSVTGNTVQPRGSNGLVKGMLAVTAGGVIVRCFNGVTGSTTAPCGFTVEVVQPTGHFRITFPFQVSDRFWLVTPESSATILEEVTCKVSSPTAFALNVLTYVDGSRSYQPFHLFLF